MADDLSSEIEYGLGSSSASKRPSDGLETDVRPAKQHHSPRTDRCTLAAESDRLLVREFRQESINMFIDSWFRQHAPVRKCRCRGRGEESCLTSEKIVDIESAIAAFRSRALREAVFTRFKESKKLLTKSAAECITEQLENIARGELLRMLSMEIQIRIFSYISVEERLQVLETISGGQAAGQRTQANFRRVVLESCRTVKTAKDFGTKWSTLRLLQATGGQLGNLRTRFPNLEIRLNGSEVQGFIQCIVEVQCTVTVVPLTGREISINIKPAVDGPVVFVQGIETTSVMMIECGSLTKAVRLINLVDLSVRNCAPMLFRHDGGAAALVNGFVYVVGHANFDDNSGRNYAGDHPKCCERYNLQSNSWERIADMNYKRYSGQLVVWNDSLYAVGGEGSLGTVECYDPDKNTWTVVFNETESIKGALHEAATVVFQDMLYCSYRNGLNWTIDMLDMRTGKKDTNLRDGLPVVEKGQQNEFPVVEKGQQQQNECVYVEEGKLCLVQLCESEEGVKWMKFVLDQSAHTWQCADCGVLESMVLAWHPTTPLLL